MRKPHFVLLIFFFCSLLIVGCGPKKQATDPEDTSTTQPTEMESAVSAWQLMGKWSLNNGDQRDQESWTFNRDGTYSAVLEGEKVSGKWRLTGNRLVIDEEEAIASAISITDTGQLKWGSDVYRKVESEGITENRDTAQVRPAPPSPAPESPASSNRVNQKKPELAAKGAPRAKRVVDNNRICRIKVGSFKGALNMPRLSSLNDLGVLTESNTEKGFTRVYLGSYLNRNTAEKILAEVKKRGFKEAYIVEDEQLSENVFKDTTKYYTFQIAAAKELNVMPFINFDNRHRDDIYISHENGKYKVSLGLYTKDVLQPQIEQEYGSYATSFGFSDGFSRVIQ